MSPKELILTELRLDKAHAEDLIVKYEKELIANEKAISFQRGRALVCAKYIKTIKQLL